MRRLNADEITCRMISASDEPADFAEAAERIDAAEHRRENGDEQIALAICGVGRIEPRQHDHRCDAGEQAREHIELEKDGAGVDAGVAGRLLV